MSDTPTPRTDAAEQELRPHFGGVVRYIFAQELERELVAANEQIRRLTEAGDAIVENGSVSERLFAQWTKAKEAKP